ncbi:MAG: D-alanyl-D-alanine carboxypeptidase family protein [Victivallaceae bacterium]
MYKTFWILVFSIIRFSITTFGLEFQNESKAVLIMNAQTGHVLFERDGHELLYPASTTKIATALFFITKYSHLLNNKAVIKSDYLTSITPQTKRQSNYRSPAHWLETDGSQIGLKIKEEVSVYDLLNATLIASANDAANCLAGIACDSIPRYIEDMNDFLRSLGCLKTHFMNPHGLHHPNHMTTAYDLALMTREALKNPLFRSITSSLSYKAQATNLESERIFSQTNRLLLPKSLYFYPYAYGVKTGSTKDAGKNLVAAASDNRRSLIGVIMGCQESSDILYKDMIRLFETVFHEPQKRCYRLQPGTQLSISIPGVSRKIKVMLQEGLSYNIFPSEPSLNPHLSFKRASVVLPLQPGDHLGTLCIFDQDGALLNKVPVVTDIAINPDSLFLRFLHKLLKIKASLITLLIILPFLRFGITKRRMRKSASGRSSYL